MDILVTGGNGLLGHHLISALRSRGDRVRLLARPTDNTSLFGHRGVTVVRGDITRPETLTEPVRGVDAVLHLAEMIGVWRPIDDYHAVNVTGVENVCRAALAEGVRRVVYVSSWAVYGMALREPAREDFLLRPFREPYAITKAAGDAAVQRMIVDDHLPAVIIRPGTFFGPGDQLHFGRIADRLAARRGLIIGPGDNPIPFVYVTDVVQGLLLALDNEHAVGQAYNITNDQPLSQGQMLRAIALEIGAAPPRLHVPYSALYVASSFAERLATLTRFQRKPLLTRLGVNLFGTSNRHSIGKARRELGYAPRVTLREGVQLAAAWYRNQSLGDGTLRQVVPVIKGQRDSVRA